MWTLFPRYIPWKVDFRHVEWLLSMPLVVSFLLESWKTLNLYGFSCARHCCSVAHSNGSAPSWKWCTASLVLNPIWRKRFKGVCAGKRGLHEAEQEIVYLFPDVNAWWALRTSVKEANCMTSSKRCLCKRLVMQIRLNHSLYWSLLVPYVS